MNSMQTGFDWEKNKPYQIKNAATCLCWRRRRLKTETWSAAVRAVYGRALRKAATPG